MEIILDTNCLYNDPYLKGADIEKLVIEADKGAHSIYIPEAVVLEKSKHFCRDSEKAYKQVEKGLKDFERLTEENLTNPLTKALLDKYLSTYEKDLRKRAEKLGISILPTPKLNEKVLLRKAIERKKPFNESGTGLPDQIIWATLLEKADKFSGVEAAANTRIILVTDNHKDFCQSDKYDLHDDLKCELEELGINPSIVKVVPDLDNAFGLLFITTDSIIAKDTSDFITGPKFLSSGLYTEVCNRIMKYLPYKSFQSEEVGFGDSFEEPTIDMFEEDFEFEIESVKVLSESEIAIAWNVSVTCLFDIYIPKSDLAYFEDDPPSVYDYDWNNHYVAAQKEKKVWFSVEVITDQKLHKIQSFEININEDRNNEEDVTGTNADMN